LEHAPEVSLAGVVVDFEEKRTRSGKYMAVFNLVDKTGLIECVVFPDTYEAVKGKLQEDAVVVVEGYLTTDIETEKKKFIVRRVYTPNDIEKNIHIAIVLSEKHTNDAILSKLKEFIKKLSDPYEGVPTYIHLYTQKGELYEIELGKDYWILPNANNLNILKTKLGSRVKICQPKGEI